METDVKSEGRQDPEEDNENADYDILLMLVNNAHADEGDWEAQQTWHDDNLLQDWHSQGCGAILFPQTYKYSRIMSPEVILCVVLVYYIRL